MRLIKYIIFIVLLVRNLLSEDILNLGQIEIFLCTSYDNDPDINYSLTNDFYVDAVSSVWGFYDYDSAYYLIERNKSGHLLNVYHRPLDKVISNGSEWRVGWNLDDEDNVTADIYANLSAGIYKISCSLDNQNYPYIDSIYICLDLRESRYPWTGEFYEYNDFYLYYDNGIYYYKLIGVNNPCIQIPNQSTITLSEIFNITNGNNDYSKFQPTTPTNLSIYYYQGNPKLVWDLSEPSEAAIYDVYRRKGINGTFSCIASGLSTNEYIDYNISYPSYLNPSSYYYYKIRAQSGDGLLSSPDYSNTVSIKGSEHIIIEKGSSETSEDCMSNAPESFDIKSNYPNPFNPVTHITFGLPAESSVILTVYTVTGNFVTNLVHDRFSAGYHTVTWDGSEYSSGIYLVRLVAGDFMKTQKMVLMK
ncbi:MAG: T9SS type A sorting domain-containing protein [Fidelibacterota bacterium]